MTDLDRFQTLLDGINLPMTHLAQVMGLNRRTLQRYASGTQGIPKHVFLALERLEEKFRPRVARYRSRPSAGLKTGMEG